MNKIFTLKADSLKILQRKIKNSKKEKVFLKYTPLEIKESSNGVYDVLSIPKH